MEAQAQVDISLVTVIRSFLLLLRYALRKMMINELWLLSEHGSEQRSGKPVIQQYASVPRTLKRESITSVRFHLLLLLHIMEKAEGH